jgi:hypothetical protein
MKLQLILGLILTSMTGYSQTMTFNTKEGQKTFNADKSMACNKEMVFMMANRNPTFDESGGKLIDKVNEQVKLSDNTKGDFAVWFTVNCNGEAFGFQVLEGIDKDTDKKIIDSLNMLRGWQPAYQGNKTVDCMQTLNFEIKKGKLRMKK